MDDSRQKMTKVLELLADDLASLRAGRATPALVEKILVEAYETKMPLVELATITASGPSELLIVPFDQSIIRQIERALSLDRHLGLSPVVDGSVIRLKIPPLTEEKRQELVKILGQKLEAARIMIRQTRGDKKNEIKRAFEAKQLNEDEKFRAENELQKLTEEFNEKIEEMGEQKEVELLSV